MFFLSYIFRLLSLLIKFFLFSLFFITL